MIWYPGYAQLFEQTCSSCWFLADNHIFLISPRCTMPWPQSRLSVETVRNSNPRAFLFSRHVFHCSKGAESILKMPVFHYLHHVDERHKKDQSLRWAIGFKSVGAQWATTAQIKTVTVAPGLVVQRTSSINTYSYTENDLKSFLWETKQTPKFNVEKSSVGSVVLGMARRNDNISLPAKGKLVPVGSR